MFSRLFSSFSGKDPKLKGTRFAGVLEKLLNTAVTRNN